VCFPIRLRPDAALFARARRSLQSTIETILDYLPGDVAGVVAMGERLIPADEYMRSSYSVWAMVANYIAEADDARGERFLLPPGLYGLRRPRHPVWLVLPGLLPIEGAPERDRCLVSLAPGGIEAVVGALAEELGCQDQEILGMGQGLITRPWLPHFIDRAAADEIADLLRKGVDAPRKFPKPLDESVYCAASWPDGIQISEPAAACAQIHRAIQAGRNTPAETLRKLREAGWTVSVSAQRHLRVAPGRKTVARKGK
jgi:hypothetical protein